ncbi:histidinol dehydrogenase [Gemmobacter sp. 24YEA27]|uniref:histidinol dehydrogenase n=1 Tax=Gemmobacter sp. 24YEA27 TaxID=3040672 RepID=UPI0024B39D24|nr:histidinol dehydrogenase [Gemmobacter sp. 24YEA27]
MAEVNFKILADLTSAEREALFARSETDLSGFLDKVPAIIEAVKTRGDAALVEFGVSFDKAEGLTADKLKVTEAEFDEAFTLVEPEVIRAIELGISNIRSFHEEQLPEPMTLKEIRPGAFAGDRFIPIDSVALYVPRGKGSFPSVTMMTGVPAVVAGCRISRSSRRRSRAARSMRQRWWRRGWPG